MFKFLSQVPSIDTVTIFLLSLVTVFAYITGYGVAKYQFIHDSLGILGGLAFSVTFIKLSIDNLLKHEQGKFQKNLESEVIKIKNQLEADLTKQKKEEFLGNLPSTFQKQYCYYSNDLPPIQLEEEKNAILKYVIRDLNFRSLFSLESTKTLILEGLGFENLEVEKDPLLLPAMAGAYAALKYDDELDKIKDNPEFVTLYNDIYLYLKVWLMISIKYGTPMDFRQINNHFDDLDLYITAFTFIKNDSFQKTYIDEQLRKSIDDELYVLKAKNLLIQYLNYLINNFKCCR